MSVSTIITIGLGTSGTPSDVVTLGYTSAFAEQPTKTGCTVARDIYQGGDKAAQVYNHGLKIGQSGCC